MIINGFSSDTRLVGADSEGWVDVIKIPYSGTTVIPSFTVYSGSKTHAFKSSEKSIVWPHFLGNYSAIRIKPGCMTFKTVNPYQASSSSGGDCKLGWFASKTQLDTDSTKSSTDTPTWSYCRFRLANSVTAPAGVNMATYGNSFYETTVVDRTLINTTSADGTGSFRHQDQRILSTSSMIFPGDTVYFYIGFVHSSGQTSDISFSYAGDLIIQGHI